MSPHNNIATPDHITEAVFKRCLERGLETRPIQIVSFTITSGSNPGDNYTSTIYRANVRYNCPTSNDHEISLIIKSIPIDETRAVIEKFGFADKEFRVYTDLLPHLCKFLEPTIVMAPKCYYIFRDPHRNIIFQDMKAEGFSVADREIGLDEKHLEIVLKNIGKFHAASMKLLEENPAIEQNFQSGFFTEETLQDVVMLTLFRDNLKIGGEMVIQMPGYERFGPKLLKIYENFQQIVLKDIALDATDIKVLNHGDLWVNNFMFKYDTEAGKPVDVVFVDYQGTFFSSPAIDLNYLFATSAQLDVLKRKLELIQTYYYPVFAQELQRHGFKSIPTFADVVKQIELREMYGLICLFGVLPLVSMDKEESKTNDFSQFVDKEKAEKKGLVGMSSARFIESMKYVLEYLENSIDDVISKY